MTVKATADQVLIQVRTTIQGLSLSGITSSNIVDMLVGDDESGDGPNVGGYPCIVVCYAGQGEAAQQDGGTNLSTDWVYPASVVILAAENRDQTTHRERNLIWRQSIRNAFHKKRLSGISPGIAYECNVRPGTVADRPRWLKNQHAQVLVVAVTVRERHQNG